MNFDIRSLVAAQLVEHLERLRKDYLKKCEHDEDCKKGETIGYPQDKNGYYGCTCGLERHVEKLISFAIEELENLNIQKNYKEPTDCSYTCNSHKQTDNKQIIPIHVTVTDEYGKICKQTSYPIQHWRECFDKIEEFFIWSTDFTEDNSDSKKYKIHIVGEDWPMYKEFEVSKYGTYSKIDKAIESLIFEHITLAC